jgi:hypothetical protein
LFSPSQKSADFVRVIRRRRTIVRPVFCSHDIGTGDDWLHVQNVSWFCWGHPQTADKCFGLRAVLLFTWHLQRRWLATRYTEVYFCHHNQNAKNIGNLTTLLKPHNIGTHLKGIETSFQVVSFFLKSFHFWVSYVSFWKFLKIPPVFRVKLNPGNLNSFSNKLLCCSNDSWRQQLGDNSRSIIANIAESVQ